MNNKKKMNKCCGLKSHSVQFAKGTSRRGPPNLLHGGGQTKIYTEVPFSIWWFSR